MSQVCAYAAQDVKGPLAPFTYELGELGPQQVDIRVESCGLCYSDISMIQNDFDCSVYPLVPGHEIVGTIEALGPQAKGLRAGQRVGLGWISGSCMHCHTCLSGDHNMCPMSEATIVARHGGFADLVRCNAEWAIPLPDDLNPETAGPLFCAGITVFNSLIQVAVRPTHRAGVIGIGGLGHMAVKFLNKWGCEVTAFTSSPAKGADAKAMGAHHVVDWRDSAAVQKRAAQFDILLLCTVNATLDWNDYLNLLGPKGRLHMLGTVVETLPIPFHILLGRQRGISASLTGSPAAIGEMLAFCARHKIEPVVEAFPMTAVNEALAHLRSGKARYRVVLMN